VISEDGDHGNRERGTCLGEHGRLLGQPVSRQIAGEQHEFAVLGDCGERPLEALSERLHRMDVSSGCHTNRRLHRKR
jgi:hypothetical protein